jgi:hypothetical protein
LIRMPSMLRAKQMMIGSSRFRNRLQSGDFEFNRTGILHTELRS